MSLLDKLVGHLGYVRPHNVTYSDAVMEAFGVKAPSGIAVNATSAMRASAVAACVAKISGAIMSMPLHVYQLKEGSVPKQAPRDALWYLLNEQPSENFTAASFWENVNMAQLLRGDGFAWIKRNTSGIPKEFVWFPWSAVTPLRTKEHGTRYYIDIPSQGVRTWLDPSDVLHFPGLGFDDVTMRSLSVIQHGARNAIGNSLAMDEYSGKFFENGAHPSIILQAAGRMDDAQIAALRLAFAEKYAGIDNAHKLPLVLTEGLKAEKISLTAEDAQLLEARKFQVLDVARAFGVPGFLINESTGATSWGTGIESIGRSFVQYTLNPWLRKIEQELNRKLYPQDPTRFIEFYRDALTEGDSKAQADYFRSALGGPGSGDAHMTVNEVRRLKRLEDKPDGNELYKAPRDPGKEAQSK